LRGAAVRANREIALLSHAIRWGMNVGLCEFERHPFEAHVQQGTAARRAASRSTSSGAM
jgi:hypothetical protein